MGETICFFFPSFFLSSDVLLHSEGFLNHLKETTTISRDDEQSRNKINK